LRSPAVLDALPPLYRFALYKTWRGVGLSAIGRAGTVMTVILIATGTVGCSELRNNSAFARMEDREVTASVDPAKASAPAPTESDLAFARNAASDVLTKGDKDSSQPWENPETGARGSVTPVAQAYSSDGRTCRDFLASYVNGHNESWLHGSACQIARGRWEIHTLKPWTRS
jgi:hypothetical protein